MQIKALEEMEAIVSENKTLFWDGWTVVERTQSEKGRTSPQGAYANGKWYVEKRHEPTQTGWEIPNKFVR
jgi:hypothetical protein